MTRLAAVAARESLEDAPQRRRRERFALVTAGHHFLVSALPFRHPETELALERFVAEARALTISEADIDAVLLRCLHVCDRHTGGRLPTLVALYLAHGSDPAHCIQRFCRCIRGILRYRGVGDPKIQQALAIIDDRSSDPKLSTREVARLLNVCPTTFCTQFRRETGTTFRTLLRDHRLDQSAALLARAEKSIKEVWAAVGYNHASNFAHDFKRRFGMSARAYRQQLACTEPSAREPAGWITPSYPSGGNGVARKTILVVDGDHATREWIATCLRASGYEVNIAATGAEGLRLVERTAPDAILLDYWLSDTDGVSLLRTLRAQGSHTPVALFTADWEIYAREGEIAALEALVLSKLCDLETVEMFVAYLVGDGTRRSTERQPEGVRR